MPQNPLPLNVAMNPSLQYRPLSVDSSNNLILSPTGLTTISPLSSTLNITSGTVVKSSSGHVFMAATTAVSSGGSAGGVYDAIVVSGAVSGTLIAPLPLTATTTPINFPLTSGLVVVPGGGQAVSVSYT